MAAPTNPRVEASSYRTTVVRWDYTGVNNITVYRSTDGISFSPLTPTVAPGTLIFYDYDLIPETKYWYKLSDDVGATYSSTVTVWTYPCATGMSSPDSIALPRAETEVTPETFNELAYELEQKAREAVTLDPCVTCPVNGQIILDCTHCGSFEVIIDQDINSIAVINCEDRPWNFDFVIPSGQCYKIGGFPPGMGFEGDESGPEAEPVCGGSDGRILDKFGETRGPAVKFKKCQACNGQTTITGFLQMFCCSTVCTLSCSGNKSVMLRACGGWPGEAGKEYTWSVVGDAILSKTKGRATTVSLPSNSFDPTEFGSNPPASVEGEFYDAVALGTCSGCAPGCLASVSGRFLAYDCAGNFLANSYSPCIPTVTTTTWHGSECSVCDKILEDQWGGGSDCRWSAPPSVDGLIQFSNCDQMVLPETTIPFSSVKTNLIDVRTPAMIAAGCNPSDLCDDAGIIVTVTDSIGNSVSLAVGT